MTTRQAIGRSAARTDGPDKVTGQARYAVDVLLPGTLWGRSLLSPFPHALIKSIDTAKAEALPGVHAVITGDDVGEGFYGRVIKDIPVLARGRVRHIGERVAAVAADDDDTARRAIDLIEVEYEELPAVFDSMEALADGSPVLHPDVDSYAGVAPREALAPNAYVASRRDRGDIERGFAEADIVVENTYVTQRVHQVYMEPHTCSVEIEPGGRVHVWASTKVPYNAREALATAAGIPEERILLHPLYIGGDFGGKGTPINLPVAYYLALHTGRPVKMVLDYVEELIAGNPRHNVVIRLKTGIKHDGTMTAHQVGFYVNAGAYAGYKPRGMIGGATESAGPYRCANARMESTHVYTNTVPGGYMRAPGEPQAVFALESHVDELAAAIGMDPLAFRMQNLVEDGEESAAGDKFDEVRVKDALAAAVDASDYGKPKPAGVGRGVAVGYRPPGGGQGNAGVRLEPDGTVVLGTPIFDQGTGTYTTLTQVVAEEFGVEAEDVVLEIWDTDSVAFDSGVAGSRATRVNTTAAYEAAVATSQRVMETAVSALGWPAESVTFAGGVVRRTDTEESASWQEVVAKHGQAIEARATIDEMSRASVNGYVAQVAEVSVDKETGEVRVLNFTTAHDVGTIVNPVGHQGQIYGAFMQGIGYALMEELPVEDGRVTTASLADYKVPNIADIPPLRTVLVPSESGVGPYQIKGIGENPIAPVAAAIANAVADAVGVRVRTLPISAEKVYAGLKPEQA